MSIRFNALAAGMLLAMFATSANAAILYNVNRVIGGGSITGTIETDGTLGVLGNANVTGWSLTLSSPNLGTGPVDTISLATGSHTIIGTAFTATATELFFDFDAGPTNIAIFFGASGNLWCMDAGGCGTLGPGDLMGVNNSGLLAEKSEPSGNVVVASTAPGGPTVALPEPSTLAFFAFAFAAIAAARRQKASVKPA